MLLTAMFRSPLGERPGEGLEALYRFTGRARRRGLLPSDRNRLTSRIVRHLRPTVRMPSKVAPITGRRTDRTGRSRICHSPSAFCRLGADRYPHNGDRIPALRRTRAESNFCQRRILSRSGSWFLE